MITTAQAAEALGISRRRVVALIEAGDLVAQKFGRQWMVDERSVLRRAEGPKLAGRPRFGQKDLLALGAHTLMFRNREVFDFTYDRKSKRAHIDRFRDGAAWAPLGTGPRGKSVVDGFRPPVPNDVDLALWIGHRYMPALRPEASRLLHVSRTWHGTTPPCLMASPRRWPRCSRRTLTFRRSSPCMQPGMCSVR